ncbi:ligand-binding sensor domain-containing protein, partial [Spirosoma sp.]|uniref:ligand-binding sensor domain-containing protein n=1 Tax=Spirosoma sp. TaxID=1899569 RepID=UPI003B3B437F
MPYSHSSRTTQIYKHNVVKRLNRWPMLLGLFLLSICWKPVAAQGPTLSFQHLGLQEGLAANFGVAISQDTAGFIWIATVNGLTRYDGVRCLNFSRESGNPHSLSHRVIRSVFTSRSGTLWVGTQEGLNRFEPATQSFQRYSLASLGPGCNFIRRITESDDGQLWLGTRGGVVRFDPATGKSFRLSIPLGKATASAVSS